MASTTLVLPFGLPPAEMAPDLVRALQTPSLATLLSRNSTHSTHAFDLDARLLPHEAWLAHALGLAGDPSTQPAAPFAPAVMRGYGLQPAEGFWFILHPVHVQIGTHLTMPDLRNLPIGEEESRTLFEAALPLFDGPGKALVYGDARTWFLRADDWAALSTASPDAASGDNLHDWMPAGAVARDFRRLQNEVQMLWHAHPVNAGRALPVNSFWMWAGAAATLPPSSPALATTDAPGWLAALAAPELRDATAVQWLATAGAHRLAVPAGLIGAALAEDWGRWLQLMAALEAEWFAPLLGALKSGQLRDVDLVLTNRRGWTTTTTTRLALNKFWRTDTLKNLLA
ncbi:hypothetical protein [Pseudoduganella lurida]|nr:hypothetical protein [Pseudoduganella lurida]